MERSMTPHQIGRYKIINRLGQGAMGVVYRAQDLDLKREVALKLVTPPDSDRAGEWRRRFQREVQAAASLNHPHIVTVYDVELEREQPYVVMELLTGGSLQEYLQQKTLAWPEALALLRPLAEALAYAHRAGVIHRDVKPANVMFTGSKFHSSTQKKGILKLVDFGLARWQTGEAITQTAGGLVGTPAYMSPEQAHQKVVDARTDIFALGIILFEAITGRNPLNKGSLISTLNEVISSQPLDLSPLADKAPPEMVRCLERAVSKDRDERYPTCEAFLDALTPFLAEQTLVSGRPLASTLPPGGRPDGPAIQKVANIRLVPEEEQILRAMYRDFNRIALEGEFRTGLSGSRVFRVRAVEMEGKTHLPAVVKIAPLDLIQKEWQAYQTYVEHHLPRIARLASPPLLPAEGWLGSLRYELAGGGIFEVQSLSQYYSQANLDDLQWVLKERLFPIMGRSWWLDNRAESAFQMQADYDSLLPINLLVTVADPPAGTNPHLIEPVNLPSGLAAGEYVQLKGFVVMEIEAGQGQLTLNLPPSPADQPRSAYRLRLSQVPNLERYRPGQVIDSINGVVSAARRDLLVAQIQQALGQELDLSQERLSGAKGLSLPNPLLFYEDILNTFRQVKISTIHGDLNLENILIDPETREVSLIDFATVRRGHALHDLLRLETEVVTKLIPEILAPAELPPETIHLIYQQLHQAAFQPDRPGAPIPPHPDLARPLAMLTVIRREARKCFFNLDDPTEYYQGLVLYLLGALKFKNLDPIPQARTVAFWGAAAAVAILIGETARVAEAWPVPKCPYRGLEFFDIEHADFFFGRERLIEELLAKLRPAPSQENHFLAIVGPSGSGKSSLARAGVIAALKRGAFAGSADWPVVTCRPSADPLRSLAIALTTVPQLERGVSDIRQMIQDFLDEPSMLDLAITLALRDTPPERRLVLLVDQFEELFTLCHDEQQRRAFIGNLLHAANMPGGRTLVLITMRADFYGNCAAYPDLARILSNHQALVGPMTTEELRQAIEQPARRAGCQFEPGLVELLLHDVADQPGSLPLLQYALTELWGHQERRRLTLAAYEVMGRVAGVLEQRAEMIYGRFSPQEQEVCRRIFLRLTQPGEGTEDTKRRVPLAELLPAGGDLTAVETVIQTLAGAEVRLVTTKSDRELEGQQMVEVAHEALIRNWSRLRAWLDENREAIRFHRRLTEAAQEWVQHDLDESYLYLGARLATIEEWAQSREEDLSALEQTFLEASLEKRRQGEAEQETFRQREMEQTQALANAMFQRVKEQASAAKRLRRLVIILAIVFLLAVGAATLARTQQQIANHEAAAARAAEQTAEARREEAETAQKVALAAQRTAEAESYARATAQAEAEAERYRAEAEARRAESRALVSAAITNLSTDPELSILLALQAISATYTVEAEQTLQRAVQTSRVRRTLTGHTAEIGGIAFSPDGAYLATAGYDGITKLWDLASGRELRTLSGHTGAVLDVAFGPDGTLLATTGQDKTIKIWDIASGRELLTLSGHSQAVWGVAFSPDGGRLASASSDQTAKLWDISSGKVVLTLTGHLGEVSDVTFSPDGRYLATASHDRIVKLWDTASGQTVLNLGGHTDAILTLAFSPDGARLATASRDTTVRVWRLTFRESGVSSQTLFTLSNQINVVWNVAFSPDGGRLATANTDGTAQVWNTSSGRLLLTLSGHTDLIGSVAFSPDGASLATGSWDRTAKIWDVASHNDAANHVLFSPDGTRLASASQDNTARVWQLGSDLTGEGLSIQQLLVLPHPAPVRRVAFSPDGAYLATASLDNTARVWDVASGRELLILAGHTNWVYGVVFSPDGTRLATTSYDKTAKIWDVDSGQELLTLTGHTNAVNDLDFSPDGMRLVTVSSDTKAKVWDATSGEALLNLPHASPVGGVAFSPDGLRVATVGVDGLVKVWDATSGQELLTLTGHTNWVRDVTFHPADQGRHLATSGYDKTAKIWDTATGRVIFTFNHNAEINSVAFSPDGTYLVTANGDGTLHLYVLELDRLVALAHSRLTRSWRPEECRQYLQQGHCPLMP
jgi:WD40 repeat protein/serine/threonine protein kinase